jgi:hypothetical protein
VQRAELLVETALSGSVVSLTEVSDEQVHKDELLVGATMADLVANVHALVAEDEKGKMLEQRMKDIRATIDSLMIRVDAIAKERD